MPIVEQLPIALIINMLCQREHRALWKGQVLLEDDTFVQAMCWGELLLKFKNANIRLRKVLLIPDLNIVLSLQGARPAMLESRFRTHDALLNYDADKGLIG